MPNMNKTMLSVSVNDYAQPVPPSALRAGQFFRIKNIAGEWSTTIHLVVDVRVSLDEPLLRRYYNFVTGECYGPVPSHWKCYVLDAARFNGVSDMVPVSTFSDKV